VTYQSFPSAQDLIPPPKPVPADDILTSDKAANDYDSALEGWAEAMRLQLGRLCRFEVSVGMKGLSCPAE
jgi:hypothetical protein